MLLPSPKSFGRDDDDEIAHLEAIKFCSRAVYSTKAFADLKSSAFNSLNRFIIAFDLRDFRG